MYCKMITISLLNIHHHLCCVCCVLSGSVMFNRTPVSCVSFIGRLIFFFYHCATWEACILQPPCKKMISWCFRQCASLELQNLWGIMLSELSLQRQIPCDLIYLSRILDNILDIWAQWVQVNTVSQPLQSWLLIWSS